MKKHHKKIIASLSFALGAVSFNAHAHASDNKQYNVNPLELYSNVTSLTMAFNEKYGKEFQLPVNAKYSVDVILKNSDAKKYMGSKTYNGYSLLVLRIFKLKQSFLSPPSTSVVLDNLKFSNFKAPDPRVCDRNAGRRLAA
jgi:hypothetical protein